MNFIVELEKLREEFEKYKCPLQKHRQQKSKSKTEFSNEEKSICNKCLYGKNSVDIGHNGTSILFNICDLLDLMSKVYSRKQTDEENNINDKETCGNPYSDLWVGLKYTIEGSEYCKNIREDDFAPAFGSALCNKCLDKECKFIAICANLCEMNMGDYEDEEED